MQKIDYTKFNNGDQDTIENVNRRWWLLNSTDLPHAVTTIVGMLGQYDSRRQTQYQISTRLYGNLSLMGVNGLSYSKIASVQNTAKDRVTYNIVSSVGETIISKMVKNKPRPLFLTSGGNYKLQRKAKKLQKFTDGIFYENHAYEMGPEALRDAYVMGDGLIHVFDLHGRVKWERVLASELYVDAIEAFYGDPRQLHWVRNIDKEVLAEMFPEHKKQIMTASPAKTDLTNAYRSVSDQVTVVESWHLPSGPEASDGLHVIVIEDVELHREKWEKPYFPFARMPYVTRMYGYWAQGGPERLQSIQNELNKLLWVKQRTMHLAGTFKIWLKNGSKISKEHLNNDIGAIITGDEQPVYLVPPMYPQELEQSINRYIQFGYEQEGVSQLSANSQKPAGLNSGKALREYNDIESDRFMYLGQTYENFFLDLAKLSIDVAKGIYEREGKFEVTVPGKKFIETIDWSEVDLEDDEYYMKVFPTSSLPQEPAGRLQTIQEYVQAGFINPRTARRLLNFPDLEQVEDLQDSQEDYMHKVFDKIIDGDGSMDTYTAPNPDDDLVLAEELALEYLSQGKLNGLEDEKLELIRTFLSQVKMLAQKAMPPMPAPVGLPQAVPQAPPVSDMISNVPGGV